MSEKPSPTKSLFGAGNRLKSMSLQARLLSSSIILVLVPALITSIMATYISSQGLRDEVFAQLESVVSLKENQIRTWLNTLQTSLNLIFTDQQSVSLATGLLRGNEVDARLDKARLKYDLKKYYEASGYFTEIFILDTDGVVVLSTDDSQEGKILSSQSFFTEGLNGSFVNPPTYELSLSNYSIVISQPLKSANGTTIGVLAGRVNLSTLDNIMNERAGLGQTGETYLVNSNFAALTNLRYQETILGSTYIHTQGVTDAVETRGTGSAIYENYQNASVMGVYHWIPELNVAVLAEYGEAEALQPANTVFRVSLIVTFITILVASFAAFIITRQISNPITKLAEAAESISRGNLNQEVTVSVDRQDEIGILATTFNLMTSRLRELIGTLEQRVADRTRALETATEVSRRLSTILDRKQLIKEVVEQLQSAFNYYHVHIYLLDENTRELVLAGGTGEAGETLLKRGHKIAYGQGLVGRTAETKQSVTVADTSLDPDWLPNPLLPETRSEIAVPIQTGDHILGVLDVQNNVVNSLTEQDAELIGSIASQIAVALLNIQSTEEVKKAQEQYALAVEGSNDGVWDWNIETNEIYFSPRWKEMIGYREDELNNGFADFEALLHPEDHDRVLNNINEYLKGNLKEYNLQFRFKHKRGTYRWIQAKGKALRHANGDPYRMAGSHTDITEAKMQQEIIASRARQQEAVNLITQKIQSTTTIENALQIAARELGHALGMKPTAVVLEPTTNNVDPKADN